VVTRGNYNILCLIAPNYVILTRKIDAVFTVVSIHTGTALEKERNALRTVARL